ncbi:MAG: pilus assembly protein [Actinomycetaceae bacterium]|nr:pilus assembly protein [Actinomycetaceae bacterium]
MKNGASSQCATATKGTGEKGNAVAGFVLVAPLVVFVLFVLVTLTYALHIRFIAQDAVREGARYASLSGGDTVLAQSRTREVLDSVFGDEYCVSPEITTRRLAGESIEVSLRCPVQNSFWGAISLPEMTVSAYAHIE